GWRWVIQGQIEGKKRDYTSGLWAAERRGRAEGMQKNAIETAQKLLDDGAMLSGRLNVIFLELPKLPKVLTPEEVKN
ncbi:MAG: hypothetical protein J6Y30_12320, partial [Treponema sp.]|nr:hypothetical protein [Treponema sp.]